MDARIPKELRDVVGVIAAEFGGEPEPFAGGVVRYYLRALRDDARLARRVATLARSPEARGTPGARIAFLTERQLLADALAAAARIHPTDRSALVRGILVAAAHDTFTTPHAARREALRAIAAAAGA
ncbi:MAG: hypothetical protein KJT01_17340 [Gemmatimonadetes bacterium]|nr:hypothetical protein [Gemmatimonadota bacterium]